MKLTKEEAIRWHRKMWSWIYERFKNDDSITSIYKLKRQYILNNYNEEISNYCFLCHYADNNIYDGDLCDMNSCILENIGCSGFYGSKNYFRLAYFTWQYAGWKKEDVPIWIKTAIKNYIIEIRDAKERM